MSPHDRPIPRRPDPGVLLVLATALCLLAVWPAPRPAAAQTRVTPRAEIRLRQEILDGVYHFAPQTDRHWIRVRSQAGLEVERGDHRWQILLNNEHRHHLTPDDIDLDWDEVIVERACWRWRAGPERWLTVGRQDIVWPGGLLVLDGNPLDGSRTMYHNAVRLQSGGPHAPGGLDLAVIHNPKRDPLVLIDDRDRALGDADETALALRLLRGGWQWALIYKVQDDPDGLLPDLATTTLGARRTGDLGGRGAWHLELAAQHQDGGLEAATKSDAEPGAAGWAVAADGALGRPLGRSWRADAGAFYYSGLDGSLRPFRTPWGRWPKWSDLYIYTLIGESTPRRSHVAAWENIAAPHATIAGPLGGRSLAGRLRASLNATWLLAPATSWQARGLLTRAGVQADLGGGLQGHLQWEMLVPGAFHDGRHGLPPLTGTVHFLRWQLTCSL